MALKDEESRKQEYFKLPDNDRVLFELEEAEKREKDNVAKKVFEKFDKKQDNHK
ncbi:hypothetical protein [Sediminibacillus halophilus]|uniref:Uncharacterized protein n=1 Tax=Sediminibacillus halophilus TaxID=482461 RepID=A0A1G9VJ13_9BACI|nr:hypothetical protein [Sediminibacillus halophilus]SDM71795.1 hypothetical protein SAMN05216244_3293 [Sediminibacillus halophilus]